MDFNNFIRQIGIPIPVTEEEEKAFPFLCSNSENADIACQHRVEYDDERCRCYRCGKLMCEHCLKRKSMPLLCHEPNRMKFDVCISCIPHVTVENLWHEQWERSLPPAKLKKYQQETSPISPFSAFAGLSLSSSVTTKSSNSNSNISNNNVLTNLHGCRCGSQFVVEKTAFEFSGSGMYQHCRNQEAALAYLMTIGCRALASVKILEEASENVSVDLNKGTAQIKGSILDDPELEISTSNLSASDNASGISINESTTAQQSIDTKTLEDGSIALDDSISSSSISSLNQSNTPSLGIGSEGDQALRSTTITTPAIDYKKEWRKAKEILLRAKRFREQEIKDEKANRLNYEKEVEVTSYWGDSSI